MSIKIRAYCADRAACAAFRIISPLGNLARKYLKEYDIQVTTAIYTDHVQGNDLVIFQRQYKPEVYQYALKMKNAGAKLVYEIDDDLLNIPDWNPAKRILGVKSVQDGIKRMISICDAMFVSTNGLVDVYSPYANNIYVLPNSLDFEFFYPPIRNSAKKSVTWQGSMTHHKDMDIMQDALHRVAKDDRYMVKLWCGFDLKTNKPIFDIPGSYVIPLVQYESFHRMFCLLDSHVGLAPLAAVKFNIGKSNIKFLEYTAQGMATVASAFGPYKDTIEHEKTGILISDNRDWYPAIMDLLENDEKRERLLKNALEFVKENYDIANNCDLWKAAIDELVASKRSISIGKV